MVCWRKYKMKLRQEETDVLRTKLLKKPNVNTQNARKQTNRQGSKKREIDQSAVQLVHRESRRKIQQHSSYYAAVPRRPDP